LLGALAACGSSDTSTSDAQTPPTTGRFDIEDWFVAGSYKTWACEPAIHALRFPSPHGGNATGYNRICSNDLISRNATGTGTWPKGAAAVKEIYDSPTAITPIGFSVYVKTSEDSDGGANWYWFERVPVAADPIVFPHDSHGIVADGMGSSGPARLLCVSCHIVAGLNAEHTTSPGGRDEVYTPVH
jgi:hypothetical protein